MATYRSIVGHKINKVSSDPAEPLTGQMWYNSTTASLRGLGLIEAFSSASPIITAATKGAGFGPVGGPNIMFGGVTPPATYIDTQIEYNGSGWASDGTYPQSLQGVGVTGVSTAAISVGGNNNGPPSFPSGVYNGPALEYNGSSWTAAPAYPVTSITQIANAGTETAAVFAGGYTYDPGSYTTVTTTNEYNGSSFSSSNAINTGRQTTVSAGTQTAAIMVGGDIWTSPSATATSNATEQYDGTSWTSVSNHPKSFSGNGFNSKSENTIINGAIPGGPDSTVFKYDGSSWSTIPGLATGRYQAASGTGSPTNAMCVSGRNPGWVTDVEEYNKSTNTVTAAAWAAGGTVPYTSRQNMSFGTQDAAINVGGFVTATLSTAASYDGSNWTASPSLNAAARIGGVAGTQSAGLQFGGIQPPGTYNANMQSWNGSSWSDSPYNLNTGTYGMMSCGTSTAALSAGGENPAGGAAWDITEEYDGEGWTSGNTMPVARYYGGGDGTQTSAFIAGGPGPNGPTTLEYDGTNWTAGGSTITPTGAGVGASGENSNSGLIFGGSPPGAGTAITQGYDGTAWSTRPSLGTGRGFTTGNGTATAGLMVSGGPPTGTSTATEEFTGETTAANIANFSTS